MMLAGPATKAPKRRRTITYKCVNPECGKLDHDYIEVAIDSPFQNETVELVRCADCTRNCVPLPRKKKQ
jgi:hypothetical protein